MKISRVTVHLEGDNGPVTHDITVNQRYQNWLVWHRGQNRADILTLEVEATNMLTTAIRNG